MTMTPSMVTIDCRDPFYLADWWCEQLGWRETMRDGEHGFAVIRSADGGLSLSFQRVGDPTPGKNKIHIDFTVGSLADDSKRLIEAGATEIREVEYPGIAWITLADPEGNQFCIAEEH